MDDQNIELSQSPLTRVDWLSIIHAGYRKLDLGLQSDQSGRILHCLCPTASRWYVPVDWQH